MEQESASGIDHNTVAYQERVFKNDVALCRIIDINSHIFYDWFF